MRHRQRHAVADILQPHSPGNIGDVSQLATERHSVQVFRAALARCRKPDFIARRRPHYALDGPPPGREFSLLSVRFNHRNRPLIVAARVFVIRKCDPFPVRRDLRRADPINGVEQHFPYGIFQPPMPGFGNVAHYRKMFPVCRPVRVLYVVHHFARSSPAQRNPGQRSRLRVPGEENRVQPECQFPILRDRKQVRILNSQFPRAAFACPRHV